MIFILSAGRSGSAWLSTLFAATGLRCRHDLYPVTRDVDVEAHTGWLWDIDGFCNSLAARSHARGVCDSIILLSRPREEIENSVTTLLGRKENWDRVFQQWQELQDRVWRMTSILRMGVRVNYEDMFKPEFKDVVKRLLAADEHWAAKAKVDDAWNFMQHMRVCNKTVEQETIDSYGPLIRN